MEITLETFEKLGLPRFGGENPERMQIACWECVVRGAFRIASSEGSIESCEIVIRDGIRVKIT
jgi:hypothetical protein